MSNIYGNQIIPNDISSLYFFDKTYDDDELTNENLRKQHAEDDGVLIGRYVLSRTVDTSGNSLTINKVFRKVATSEGVDYEQVAILDAVTPTFHTKTVNINKELFDINNTTFKGYVPISTNSTDNTISISATGPRDYTKVGAPIEHDVEINLPVLGETVASMNNLMYGQTNRAQIVQGTNALVSNIKVGGRTLEADGVIGVLGSLDWKALKDANKVDWALKYLKITEDPGQTISDDYLSLGGGIMTNAATIRWAGAEADAFLTGISDAEGAGSLLLHGGGEYISLNKNDGITMTHVTADSLKVGLRPRDDKDVVRYDEVKRLVSQGGTPYILTPEEITHNGDTPGANIIQVPDKYSNLPKNTIFFVKVAGN